MHKLRCLDCDSINFSSDLSLLTFLEWFPALETLRIPMRHLPSKPPPYFDFPRQLKHVELPQIVWIYDDDDCDDSAEVAHFFEYLLGRSKIDTVCIRGVQVAREVLLMFATIATLKVLDVQFDHSVGVKDLLQLIKTLGEATVIEWLTIRDIPNISLAMAV